MDSIRNDFNKSLDKLLDTNLDNIGQTNITSLYARTQNIKGSLGSDTFSELLEDNALTEALVADFSQNKIYKEVDAEIDLILKFMPMLADALDAKKDNVLSADNYSKDYINVVNTDSVENFSENIKSLKKIYNVLNIVENAYDDAAKYGEQFIYIDNYKDALTKLLKNKPRILIMTKKDLCDMDVTLKWKKYIKIVWTDSLNTETVKIAGEILKK